VHYHTWEVRTNTEGFVETYTDGSRCAGYIGADEVRAEPGLWLPWLLTIYSEPGRHSFENVLAMS
jgi:hypothetical protein